jgi:CBS domain-containing protein
MRDLDVGPMPVAENGRPIGIVTDRDIVLRAVADGKDGKATRVREVMSGDVVTCREDEDVEGVAEAMKDRQVRRVLVVDDGGKLSGIVSLGDVAVDTSDEKMSGRVLEEVSRPAGAGAVDERRRP